MFHAMQPRFFKQNIRQNALSQNLEVLNISAAGSIFPPQPNLTLRAPTIMHNNPQPDLRTDTPSQIERRKRHLEVLADGEKFYEENAEFHETKVKSIKKELMKYSGLMNITIIAEKSFMAKSGGLHSQKWVALI